jgi:hypothetical protein
MTQIQPYAVQTRNVSINSENRIHDDSEARKYGFSGGLVPGTAVYAHMTRPLAARFGLDWLGRNTVHLVLLKPAYEGDRLTAVTELGTGPEHPATVRIYNAERVELAWLDTSMPAALPAPDPLAILAPAPPGPRTPIGWDSVEPGQPLRAYPWMPTGEMQEQWCVALSDDLTLYRAAQAPVHPGLILQAANGVLSHHYVLEPWIHTESRIATRRLLRLGEAVEVRAVPLEKWEKKGHQFFRVYVAMVSGGETAVEVWHTAIFRVRRTG